MQILLKEEETSSVNNIYFVVGVNDKDGYWKERTRKAREYT
jgi:hypothetical protein